VRTRQCHGVRARSDRSPRLTECVNAIYTEEGARQEAYLALTLERGSNIVAHSQAPSELAKGK
jgi:hypothetical protein